MKIGLVIGHGTGKELVEIFKDILYMISNYYNFEVEVVECPYVFNTYASIRTKEYEEIEKIVKEEVSILDSFYKSFYDSGGRVIFRTAINAETLYIFRKLRFGVKVIDVYKSGHNILMIRDETQGFYTVDSYRLEKDSLYLSSSFKKNNIKKIINYSINIANEFLNVPFDTWVVYKHHLFSNVLEKWVKECYENARMYQPNHATELMWRYLKKDNTIEKRDLLIIMGNEVGDILHEAIIFTFGLGNRQTLFSKNVYFHPDIEYLTEYQTVHGSVDQLKGRDLVNPIATLRALAAIVRNHLNISNFSPFVEESIDYASERTEKKFATSLFMEIFKKRLYDRIKENRK